MQFYIFIKKAGHFFFLLVMAHLLWLIFYYLSTPFLLAPDHWNIFLKQLLINTISFIAFYTGAFLLFPNFVTNRKFIWLAIISIALSISLGSLQFSIQNWQPALKTVIQRPITPGGRQVMPAVNLVEPIGADVKAVFNILIFILFGISYAYSKDWFVKDRKARVLEKEKIKAELTLLRYQLNPHFLFNTINDIYYLTLIKSDKTPEALLQLSSLLRYVLNEKEERVSLDKEVEYLKQFILLHKFRFPDDIVIQQTNIDFGINSLYIAPLLLITFIENAFKHGEPGTEERPVLIGLGLENGVLEYKVTNYLAASVSKNDSSGIGLTNLSRRLSLLYPNAHEVSFSETGDLFIARLKIKLNHDIQHSY